MLNGDGLRVVFWLAGCDNMCPWDEVDLST
jgi:pyruvate-formate lyase-activating enzyme